MDQKQWFAFILREANAFLAPREPALKNALAEHGHLRDFEAEMEGQLRDFLAGTDDLNDVIRYSGLTDKNRGLWRDADDWDSAVFRVAYACLTHDVMQATQQILKGKLPKASPDQIIV